MTNRTVDVLVAGLALVQHGAFSRQQVLDAGGTDRLISMRLHAGRWRRAAPGVYLLAGVADSYEQRLWILHLAAGPRSLVSHESAARVRSLFSYTKTPKLVLLTPHGDHRRFVPCPGWDVTLHETRDIWEVSSTKVDGLPVTTVARTMLDLSLVTRFGRLQRVYEDALRGKVREEEVQTELQAQLRRGKGYLLRLGAVLDKRRPGDVPPRSELERSFDAMMERYGPVAGLVPVREWEYPYRRLPIGCGDRGFPMAMVCFEVDGREWHDRIQQSKNDKERDAEAARVGVQIVRLLHEHVVGDPRGTWELVNDTVLIRLRQFGLVA